MSIRYGVTQWSLPGHGAYAVKYASEAGFSGLQIEIGSHEDGYYMAQKKVQDDYMSDAEKYGITFPSIVVNCLSTHGFASGKGNDDYDIAMESLELTLETAKIMGIDMIMIPQFWNNEIKDNTTFENSVKVLRQYCASTMKQGIRIASETTLPAEKQIEFMKSVNAPNLSVFYDSQNYRYFKGYDQKETIQTLYPYFCDQLHVKDGTGMESKGGVLSGSMLGHGDSDFEATVACLKSNHYCGWLIVENYYYVKSFRDLGIGQFEAMEKDLLYLKSIFDE
jgi:sugar phosphate isomerase/epimerase